LDKNYGSLDVMKGVDIKVEKWEVISIVGLREPEKPLCTNFRNFRHDFQSSKCLSFYQWNGRARAEQNRIGTIQKPTLGVCLRVSSTPPRIFRPRKWLYSWFYCQQTQKEVEAEAARLLDFFWLSDLVHHKLGQLSGGRTATHRCCAHPDQQTRSDFCRQAQRKFRLEAAQNLPKIFGVSMKEPSPKNSSPTKNCGCHFTETQHKTIAKPRLISICISMIKFRSKFHSFLGF